MRLIPELPYLDSAGHVYLPLAAADGSCLKLNRAASLLWRAVTAGPVDQQHLDEPDRAFLHDLVRRGVARTENDGEGS